MRSKEKTKQDFWRIKFSFLEKNAAKGIGSYLIIRILGSSKSLHFIENTRRGSQFHLASFTYAHKQFNYFSKLSVIATQVNHGFRN